MASDRKLSPKSEERTSRDDSKDTGSHKTSSQKILDGLDSLLTVQRRIESDLSLLVAEQRTIAQSLSVGRSGLATRKATPDGDTLQLGVLTGSSHCRTPRRSDDLPGNKQSVPVSFSGEITSTLSQRTDMDAFGRLQSDGFMSAVAEAEAAVGAENVIAPTEAKALLESSSDALFLDVSELDDPPMPDAHRTPFSRLPEVMKNEEEEDHEVLVNHQRWECIVVTCPFGIQAKLACKILLDSGFTNVKAVEGGNAAWRTDLTGLPLHWPSCLERRRCFNEDDDEERRSETDFNKRRSKVQLKRAVSNLSAGPSRQETSPLGVVTNTSCLRCLPQCLPKSRSCSSGVLAPSSPLRIFLDLLSIVVLVFDLITVPWYFAWDVPIEGWLAGCSIFIVCFWTLDILVTFRTGFFLHGKLYMKPVDIAKRYLKSWFVPDLIVVSLDWTNQILLFTEEPGVGMKTLNILRFVKWSRLLRLFRMMRFIRFSDLFDRVFSDFSYYSPRLLILFQVVRILFIIFYLNHAGACLWWWVGVIEDGNGWTDLPVSADGFAYRDADLLFQYTTSLHCAMTQILAGSMQVPATNSLEQGFSVACLISGVIFASSLVSTLASRMTQLRMMQQDRSTKLSQLREFLHRKAIGAELGVNIIKQVDEGLKERRPDTLQDLLAWDAVSERNKIKLHRELCRPHLLRHPFFHLVTDLDAVFLRALCDEAAEIVMFAAEDSIFSAGTPARSLYMVVSGSLRYTQHPEMALVPSVAELQISKNQWLCEAALWTQWTHVGNLEATAATELMTLKAQVVGDILSRNTFTWQMACEYSRAFHFRLQTATPPYSEWPNDVTVPCTSFHEVVNAFGKEVKSTLGLLALQHRGGQLRSLPWLSRLRDEVSAGTSTLVIAPSGELELLSSAAVLHLRMDGKVLMQLGTWDGEAASPCCRLPTTELVQGEIPRMGFQRLLRTQLTAIANAITLETSASSVEQRVDAHVLRIRTNVTKHYARVDSCRWPYLPTACSVTRGGLSHTSLTHSSFPSFRRASTGGSTDSAAAQLTDVQEVFVVAGARDGRSNMDEEQPEVVRLYAWLDPRMQERLQGSRGGAELKAFLAGVVVTHEAHREALQMCKETFIITPGSKLVV